jgi:hypothetical protein
LRVEPLESRTLLAGLPHPDAGMGTFRAGVQAYIYGYPLVVMGVTQQVMSNEASAGTARAPQNQFAYGMLATPANTDVVLPNVNVLYATAWLNLTAQPIVLHIPDVPNRFYLLEILDAWTNVDYHPGTQQNTQEGNYLITGPNWQGTVPAGITQVFAMPTNTAWIAGRTYTTGTEADFIEADAIQHEYKLTPLSSFTDGQPYTPPTDLPVNPAIDESTTPVAQVANMSAGTFFGTLAAMFGTIPTLTNPPLPADAAAVANLEAIGLIPGHPFDISTLPRKTAAALEHAARLGERIVSSDATVVHLNGRAVNGWSWSTNLGQYGTNYLGRAVVAYRGLGANLSEDAVYFYAQQDSRGVLLNGNNQYTLTFPAGQLPPVNPSAYWSVTMYNAAGFLVGTPDNLGTTQINAGLQPNKNGSYEFFIQATEPTDPAEIPYWIKAPAGQNFLLILRAYWPSSAILDKQYVPPPVVRTLVPPTPLTPTARRRLRTPFIPQRLGSLIVPN